MAVTLAEGSLPLLAQSAGNAQRYTAPPCATVAASRLAPTDKARFILGGAS